MELSRRFGIPQATVSYRKKCLFNKIQKEFMEKYGAMKSVIRMKEKGKV